MTSKLRFLSKTLIAAAFAAGAMTGSALAQAEVKGEHYLCYRIDPHGGFKEVPVELKDQFAAYQGVVIRPIQLCNPVDKNGEGILNPEVHLVCYEIKADPIGRFPRTVDVETANQFTEQSMTAVLPPPVLCVPSFKREM